MATISQMKSKLQSALDSKLSIGEQPLSENQQKNILGSLGIWDKIVDYGNKIIDYGTKIESILGSIAGINTTLNDHTSSINSINQSVSSVNSNISQQHDDISYLQSYYNGGCGNRMYMSNDTHIMKLGYWQCTGGYDNLTLLINCSFWGNQHGNGDILYFSQDLNNNSSGTIQCTCQITHLGGNRRTYYYYKDNSTFRLYFYVYVTGGNSYGKWTLTTLGRTHNNWVTDIDWSQTLPSGSTEIYMP